MKNTALALLPFAFVCLSGCSDDSPPQPAGRPAATTKARPPMPAPADAPAPATDLAVVNGMPANAAPEAVSAVAPAPAAPTEPEAVATPSLEDSYWQTFVEIRADQEVLKERGIRGYAADKGREAFDAPAAIVVANDITVDTINDTLLRAGLTAVYAPVTLVYKAGQTVAGGLVYFGSSVVAADDANRFGEELAADGFSKAFVVVPYQTVNAVVATGKGVVKSVAVAPFEAAGVVATPVESLVKNTVGAVRGQVRADKAVLHFGGDTLDATVGRAYDLGDGFLNGLTFGIYHKLPIVGENPLGFIAPNVLKGWGISGIRQRTSAAQAGALSARAARGEPVSDSARSSLNRSKAKITNW